MSNEINVGAISEALNNKVDLNQLNTNSQGLEYVSGLSMPSGRYIDLTLGASGSSYTAPANGWYLLRKVSTSAGQYAQIINTNNEIMSLIIAQGNNSTLSLFTPILKNKTVKIDYNAGGTLQFFRFIYAQGEQ